MKITKVEAIGVELAKDAAERHTFTPRVVSTRARAPKRRLLT